MAMTGHEEMMGTVGGPLMAVTAAELAVLERAHLAGLRAADGDAGVGADLDDTPDLVDTTDSVLSEARRSLLSRGLLQPDGRLAEETAPADLAALLLDIRLGAAALIVIERRIAGREHLPDLRILHLIPEGGVIEDVHPEGLVGLDLQVDPAELVHAALAPVLPSDAAQGRGEARFVDPQHPELFAKVLDEPGVLAELTLAAGDGQRVESYLLAVGRSGCWLSRAAEEVEPTGDERPDPQLLTFDPVSPDDVQELIARWVDGVVEPIA